MPGFGADIRDEERGLGVLIVAKINRGSAGGYAEYLEGKTRSQALGDYYLKDGERIEAPGRWAAGAKHFGLDPGRPVTGEQLRTLMDVRRPDTGDALRRVGGSGEAVAAIDATFSAPKSVSAVWALADRQLRERIERAHETAVDRALAYAVRQVPMLRRRVSHDTVLHEKPGGLVATSWRHTTARAVAKQVPDPQLHSHVLLHAAVRRDGRLVAIDSRSWLVHQREVGAAYRTELARELNELGFTVVRGTGRAGRYFELDGVPQGLLDRWSSRRHQVQAAIRQRLDAQDRELRAAVARGGPAASEAAEQLELLRRFGQLSPKEERWAATETRSTKSPITMQDLDTDWRREGLRHGVSRERIEVLHYHPHPALDPADPELVLEALTEFDATFPAREARAIALERSAGAPIQAALEQLRVLRASDEILLLADGTGTTRDHRGRERAVVAITERLAERQIEPLPSKARLLETRRLDRELSKLGGRLSSEQREAIRLGCAEHQLVVIQGHAGTGKSTTLTGIARAHQTCGRQIIVTSTAALAAERLAGELADRGVTCTAYSTAGLHAAISSGRLELGAETTVIHDEAALASTREQLRLLREVEASGARLIEVGDPRQNQPVGAGGLWDQIEHATRDAGAHVELTVNQRARDPGDRRDQARFREGQAELAVRGYAARDRIHLNADQQRIEDQALDAAQRDRAAGASTIVIAQTSNEQIDALNARAQAIRHQHHELGEDSLELPGRPYRLYAGDRVQIRRTIAHPDHGQLRNGTSAEIVDVDPRSGELELKLADGTRPRLSEEQLAVADLRLAYVQHPFPAQGHTVETAHVIITGRATREGSYVALTRAREQTHIYAADSGDRAPDVDRLQDLAARISRTEPEVPSISTPLAHETAIHTSIEHASERTETREREVEARGEELEPAEEIGAAAKTRAAAQTRAAGQPDRSESAPRRWPRQIETDQLAAERATARSSMTIDPTIATSERDAGEKIEQTRSRVWPRRPGREPRTVELERDELEQDRSPGWEL